MKKKIIILGIVFVIGMNFAVGCSKNTDALETRQDIIEVSKKVNEVEGDMIESDEYIIEKSNREKLVYDDVCLMDEEKLDYARNEIYARHGYVFNSPDYQNYFESKTWYKPAKDNASIILNEVEQYNVAYLGFFKEIRQKEYSNKEERVREQDVYEANKEIYLDINGDGIDEVIIYKCHSEGDSVYADQLCVNDNIVEAPGFAVENFAIVDIDTGDAYKEILISNVGPSDDYRTDYYIFRDNKITHIGRTEGLFSKGIKLNGDGTFTARTRTDFLHTWHYAKEYYLGKNHDIAEFPEGVYEDNTLIFLKEPYAFYFEPEINSDKFILNDVQALTIVEADLHEWAKIETKSGQIGWLRVLGYNQLEDGKSIHEIFEGLFFYD